MAKPTIKGEITKGNLPIFSISGSTVVKNQTYTIANSKSENKFQCVIHNPKPSDLAFMRTHDCSMHYAREFIEFKKGKPYYNVAEYCH